MARPDLPPRARAVLDLDELLARAFRDGENALCLPRAFDADVVAGFDEVARLVAARLADDDDLVALDDEVLRSLPLSSAGRLSAGVMIDDLARLTAHGREPTLNCIRAYARDRRGLPIATDVMSFHVDRAEVEVDTFLCTYAGAPSELLDTDDATRLIDDDTIRSALQIAAGIDDDNTDAFARFVSDGSFDLHYRPKPGTRVFSCGRFALWKLAVAWPGARVPPCIHRAPSTTTRDPPRLLLIA